MSSRFDELRILSGNGNPALAQAICGHLGVRLGDVTITRFANENIFVRLNESVREKDVFVIQSLASPLSDRILELLIMLDACKRASAGRVTAVLPFYAYGRTDKRDQPRVPITARLLADMIQVAGAQQVVTVDLHAGQIQGFFSIPVNELSGMSLLVRYFRERGWNDVTVVSSDIGFAKRARNFAEMLGAPLAIVEKRHPARADAESENGIAAISLIGDVAGRRCILVDDEVNTGRSLVSAAELLERHGAREIYAAVTHPVLGGDGAERLRASNIRELVTTDTLPVPAEKAWPGLRILTVAPMLAEAIQRIHSGVSVHTIFPPRALAH
ncbi:MAG: ribose-phosphate pyrophosphokinase [Roseiflexus sp.]|nr:ribose-phosphate pyrophosphokinase [Roseiflexus sp.]MCS7289034.1 ribose-phosphate pyrophosphokinase [Roseiflexus sp.]MDW8145347.1 ribose-phosphate pyrophosphokinase [Roseiflexaceae bacterium]MDW8232661.1 ribose-phosphate pyrophosphokinase [Roseiflexaceae bacterium]